MVDIMDSRARKNFRGGFTLLEVMVALALLATVLLLISRLFSYDMRSIAASGDFAAAVAAAQEELRGVLGADTITEGDTRQSVDGLYDVDVSIHPVLEDRTENLNLKLMEVDLTVHWTSGGKYKSYTLNTLKVVEGKP